ncbi:hypothetical protein HMN09_01210900 [Mycena chlorophos]|uniref:Uncharacterized protein n=1 Tax=Mycena chlorophos TaxID=658473 RepID=A0A8H6S559_MYCCL|nr:hypothetical protein HMN09_01210900 [Mycena chlorophos]
MCEKCNGCTGFDPGSATTITSKTKCARRKCKHKQKYHKEVSVKGVVSLWQTKARTDVAVAETNRGLKSKPPGSSTEGSATRSGKRKKAAPTRKTFGVGSIQLSPNGILVSPRTSARCSSLVLTIHRTVTSVRPGLSNAQRPGVKTLPAPDGITFNDLVTAGLAVIATDGNIQFYVDATEDEIDGALRDHFPLPFEYDTLRHPDATGRRWGLVTRANRRLSAVTASKVTGSTLKLYKGGQGKSPTEARLHFVLIDKIPSHIISNLPAAIEALKRGEYVDSDSDSEADDDNDDEAAPAPRRLSQRGKGKAKQQPESESDSDSADSDEDSDESGDEDKSEWKGTGSGNDNEDDTSSNANDTPVVARWTLAFLLPHRCPFPLGGCLTELSGYGPHPSPFGSEHTLPSISLFMKEETRARLCDVHLPDEVAADTPVVARWTLAFLLPHRCPFPLGGCLTELSGYGPHPSPFGSEHTLPSISLFMKEEDNVALKRSRSAERFMSSKRLHLDPSVIESDNDDCNSMSAGAGPSRIREQPHRAAAAPRVVPPSPRYRDLLPKVANPWKSV